MVCSDLWVDPLSWAFPTSLPTLSGTHLPFPTASLWSFSISPRHKGHTLQELFNWLLGLQGSKHGSWKLCPPWRPLSARSRNVVPLIQHKHNELFSL